MGFERELRDILENDPLGLLDIKPAKPSALSPYERLLASFEEINLFVREQGREPAATRDIYERRLYSRLKGLREDSTKAATLLEFDSCGLLGDVELAEAKEIETITDVLDDDVLGLLGEDGGSEDTATGIFTLRHVPATRTSPDLVAKRKPCNEFEQFEPLFQQCHVDLASGARVLVPFNSERRIVPDRLFLLQGMLVYVANMGSWEKRKFGKGNARLYCVFENGTESNMLLRSLAAALWKDEGSREAIEGHQVEMFTAAGGVGADDEPTGYVYVLRSLSRDPRIEQMENLFKIGFSSQSVKVRTKNAAQDPTFLMADVAPVAEFQTFNLNPQKLELLLHKFFAVACLNLDVVDDKGQIHKPREWFVVPLPVIEAAVQLLQNGEIVHYRYDAERQELVGK